MQFVVVDVCANRTLLEAAATLAAPPTANTTDRIVNARIAASPSQLGHMI